MARFYANENFRRQTVEALERLGHDALTSLQAGNANLGIPDDEVLDFARSENRIVLTFNRRHFIKLHRENPIHPGIVVCTEDNDHVPRPTHPRCCAGFWRKHSQPLDSGEPAQCITLTFTRRSPQGVGGSPAHTAMSDLARQRIRKNIGASAHDEVGLAF